MKAAGTPPNSSSSFNGCTVADLITAFNRPGNAQQIGRPVVDKTGIAGKFFMLVWQAHEIDTTYDGPGVRYSYSETFREAVEKELGLKLVDDKQTMRSVNVLSVTHPNPD